MSGIIAFAIGLIFAALIVWSYFIFHHFRTYMMKDDETNRVMLAVFVAGTALCIVLGAFFFFRIPWNEITLELPASF